MAKPIGNGHPTHSASNTQKTFLIEWDDGASNNLIPDSSGWAYKRGSEGTTFTSGAPTVASDATILTKSNDFVYVASSVDFADGNTSADSTVADGNLFNDGSDDGIYDIASAFTADGGRGADQIIMQESAITINDDFFTNLTNFEAVKLADGDGSTLTLDAKAAAAGIREVGGGSGDDTINLGAAYDDIDATIVVKSSLEDNGTDTVTGFQVRLEEEGEVSGDIIDLSEALNVGDRADLDTIENEQDDFDWLITNGDLTVNSDGVFLGSDQVIDWSSTTFTGGDLVRIVIDKVEYQATVQTA